MNTRHDPPSVGLRCLLAVVAGLVMLGLAPGASAQDLYSMADQLNQLQREVADLQRQVFAGGGASAGSAVGGGSAAAAGQEVRLQQMDEQIRGLTGQVEQLSYKLQQLTTKLDKLAGDVDFRLNALEQGSGAGAENPPQREKNASNRLKFAKIPSSSARCGSQSRAGVLRPGGAGR